eukprot:TRINITY_DN3460_c0_g1_i3.p1 TRINITY_DN3460_c0_g1~~TRINITY_DN3460_c0_g1_i3.p1  ORF type:complete len:230 (+),score=57.42 TRINITY_DN3460_c0_g1_i3:1042-1731(+)
MSPSESIFIDGVDIKKFHPQKLRQLFGVVSQEPVLFYGTIEENIKYNTANAQFEDIKLAAKQANALDFIEADNFEIIKQDEEQAANSDDKVQNQVNEIQIQPEIVTLNKEQIKNGKGFNRHVGPKGQQISGGQKQRIAIARALLKKPHILLLDEATSALDAKNEQIVQDSLDEFMNEKTIITIAHRIQTIQNADIIYVLEEGKVVEQGNFQELMNKRQHFYNLKQGLGN